MSFDLFTVLGDGFVDWCASILICTVDDSILTLYFLRVWNTRSEDVEETTMNVDFTDCVNAKLLNKQCCE